ncbi:MAG: 16S rRNA processing protein RimM [Anaerolineales bacterium]|nr:16S rRNA processing protein RimM [Anaerolineales bacterium]MCB8963254.1 16S rRNA processing protein RimM [Ardenticatenales bacterium]
MANKHESNSNRSERGSKADSAEPRFLIIGRIGKPHGVHGEMRVTMHTDEPERFTWLEQVYLGLDDPQPVPIVGVRFHKNWALLALEGYESRDAVESLRGEWLQVPEDEAIPLEEGELFLYQLIGLQVRTSDGELIGEISEIIETPANNVFVVKGDRGERLIPDIDDVVQDIDVEQGVMIVTLLPGM